MEFLKEHSEIEDWVEFTRRNWSPFDEKLCKELFLIYLYSF